jgi:hypothetical protein
VTAGRAAPALNGQAAEILAEVGLASDALAPVR